MLWYKKRKNYAVFVGQQEGGHIILGKKQFEAGDDSVRFKERSFPVCLEKPTYQKGLDSFYFFNIDSNVQLHFGKAEMSIKPKLMDMIMSKSIIAQLTEDLTKEQNYLQIIMYLVVGFLMGGMLGFIIAQFLIGGGGL